MIGSTVRAARRRAGVTQAELAQLCSTSQPAIARLEKGLVAPTVVSLDRIARALGAELVIDFEPVAASDTTAAPAATAAGRAGRK
jgi:transcriptional regulator with XRE-family HTH domain